MNNKANQIKNFIKKCKGLELTKTSVDEIIYQVQDIILRNPFPTVSLRKGEVIERIRNNYNGEIFKCEKDISFRCDIQNITEFGRANLPKSSIFYGSLPSAYINTARVTNLVETNKYLRSGVKNIKTRQIFTGGQWEVVGDLKLLILPFNKAALKINNLVSDSNKIFTKNINVMFSKYASEILELLEFFADEFAKPVTYSEEYKISAAFSHVLINDYQLDGVLYPSLRAEFKSYNIALSPTGITKIKLIAVGLFEAIINNDQVLIDNIAYALELGENNNDFQWIYVDRTSEDDVKRIIGS